MVLKFLIFAIILVEPNCAQFLQRNRFRNNLSTKISTRFKVKERLLERLNRHRERNTETICYETVGCFALPHKHSPLQKVPENPDMLNTKFYLFTRAQNSSQPEILNYDDDETIKKSSFDPKKPLKMIIHGYMGRWTERGTLIGAQSYLKLYDCNMILMDWSVGARGPQYAVAAANTEIVGRQLGLLLLKMCKSGLDPDRIHLLGFSLGAHVAGTASEVLKEDDILMGRITGLDAASPLFRTDHLREKYKKLDKSDAKFVDVIHTDSSPVITDGFGLWEPLGHVDFFPNGGQQQPGCVDTRQSIVATHFDRGLTKDIACSHIRAWKLFQESLQTENDCEFVAFKCLDGLKSFENGKCFPDRLNFNLTSDFYYKSQDLGRFGENASGGGVMYFSTNGKPPFCGTQVHISLRISPKSLQTTIPSGYFQLSVNYLKFNYNWFIDYESSDWVGTVATVDYKSLDNVTDIGINVRYYLYEDDRKNQTLSLTQFSIHDLVLRDFFNANFHSCDETLLEVSDDSSLRSSDRILSTAPCKKS